MEAHRTAIADWIVRAALEGADEIEVLAGICERLNALGLALMRASVASNIRLASLCPEYHPEVILRRFLTELRRRLLMLN